MSDFSTVQHDHQSAQAAKAAADSAHTTERRTPNVSVKTGSKAVITVRNGEAFLDQPKVASHNVADNKPTSSPANSGSTSSSNAGERVVTAKSSMGRLLTGSDVRENSIVNIGGIETTVSAAKALGKIRVNASGVLVYADASLASNEATTAAPKGQPKAQQQEQPAEVEALDPASENVMQEIVSSVPKLGNMDVHAAQKHLIEEGSMPADLLNRVSTAMGQEPTAVAAKFEQVRQAFTKQANDVVGPHAEEVFQFARQHAPQELRAAIDQQVKHGSTKGYQAVAQKFMQNLDRLHPDLIVQSSEGQQLQARRENDGSVSLVHPKLGRVSWRVAIAKGLFSPSFKSNPFTRG